MNQNQRQSQSRLLIDIFYWDTLSSMKNWNLYFMVKLKIMFYNDSWLEELWGGGATLTSTIFFKLNICLINPLFDIDNQKICRNRFNLQNNFYIKLYLFLAWKIGTLNVDVFDRICSFFQLLNHSHSFLLYSFDQ